MDTLEHIEALIRVWKERADQYEDEASCVVDSLIQVKLRTKAQMCREHARAIEQVLKKK